MGVAIIISFIIGYVAITLEHTIKINKAATALITGVICWTVYILSQADKELVTHELMSHLGELSGILFFLMGAMTIVELIDAHDGFQIITEPRLDGRALIGKEAILKCRDVDLRRARIGKEGLRRTVRFLAAGPDSAEHGPVHVQQDALLDPAEDRRTGADLDVVGVRTDAKHRQRFAWTRDSHLLHRIRLLPIRPPGGKPR